jgi:flavodoxin/NAD-dependent dihydropyrimidine dehydrogenase PreA subunit
MPKTLIIYYSQGGTTEKVARAIGEGLSDKGHTVDFHSMIEGRTPDLEGYGLLGVGLPVYYFRPPFKVMDVLSELPDLNGLPVFVFLLYGTLYGDTGTVVRNALREKGGREAGYFVTKGADYFYGYIKRGYLFSPDNPTPLDLEGARSFGESVAERSAIGETIHTADDCPPPWVFRLERFLSNRWFTKWMYSRMFIVRKDQCGGCGLCVKLCPMSNITADENGRPVWGSNCILCLYCEMKCPNEAIVSPVSWPIFSPFMAYNVWKAKNDPSLEHVRVAQGKGHTRSNV